MYYWQGHQFTRQNYTSWMSTAFNFKSSSKIWKYKRISSYFTKFNKNKYPPTPKYNKWNFNYFQFVKATQTNLAKYISKVHLRDIFKLYGNVVT